MSFNSVKGLGVSETVEERGLRFPWVNYPPPYDCWISFQSERESQPYFCACARPAVEAFLLQNEKDPVFLLPSGCRNLLLHFFRPPLSSKLQVFDLTELQTSELFVSGLCHVCASRMPARITPERALLDRHYGWYVLQEVVAECGVRFGHPEATRRRARRRLCQRLGLPDQDQLRSEDALYLTVRGSFPGEPIQRHVRPEILEGLELDIYLPNRRLGIEYQGEQHSAPVEMFGGENAFVSMMERDERKRHLCEKHGVILKYFQPHEPITHAYIESKLGRYLRLEEPANLPANLPKTELQPSGPEWEALSLPRKIDVVMQIWAFEQVELLVRDRGISVSRACREVVANFETCFAASVHKGLGFSHGSLMRKYAQLGKLGRSGVWQNYCRYHPLLKPKAYALHERGLTVETVKAFFRLGGGLTQWARQNHYSPYRVRAILAPLTRGSSPDAREIAACVAKDIRRVTESHVTEIQELRKVVACSQKRIEELKRRLRLLNGDVQL